MFGFPYVWEGVVKGYKGIEDEPLYPKIKEIGFLKDIKKKDKKSLVIIYQTMNASTFEKISNVIIAKKHGRYYKMDLKGLMR